MQQRATHALTPPLPTLTLTRAPTLTLSRTPTRTPTRTLTLSLA